MATRIILLITVVFLLTAAGPDQAQSDSVPPLALLIGVLLLTAALLRLAHPQRKKHLQ
jgi:hypothetical protein